MTVRGLSLVCVAAFLTAAANLLLRGGVLRAGGFSLSADRLGAGLLVLARQPLFLVGLALYVAAALLWFHVISTEPLSSGYPLIVSLTFVLVTLGAVLFFHEPVSWQKLVGLSIIVAGIALVARA